MATNDTAKHRMHVRLTDAQLAQLYEAAMRDFRTTSLELQRVLAIGFEAAYGKPPAPVPAPGSDA